MEVASGQVAECPACQAIIPFEATSCPSCGEPFPEGAANLDDERDGSTISDSSSPQPLQMSRRRQRLLLYVGLFLMLVGGPGIAIFSWLLDVLHISVMNYDSFTVFGPMNRLVVAIGIIVAIVGIALFILALRFARPTAEELEIRESRTS
jgi:hypothetical protein